MWPAVDENEQAAYGKTIRKTKIKPIFVDMIAPEGIEATLQGEKAMKIRQRADAEKTSFVAKVSESLVFEYENLIRENQVDFKEQMEKNGGPFGDLSCCNLTPTGCLLPRRIHPFICTWYICPSQIAMLSERMDEESKTLILSSIQEIKFLRNCLEDMFIKAALG